MKNIFSNIIDEYSKEIKEICVPNIFVLGNKQYAEKIFGAHYYNNKNNIKLKFSYKNSYWKCCRNGEKNINQGILKSNWISKHLYNLPAVIISCLCIKEYSENELKFLEESVKCQISTVKSENEAHIKYHFCRLFVLVIQLSSLTEEEKVNVISGVLGNSQNEPVALIQLGNEEESRDRMMISLNALCKQYYDDNISYYEQRIELLLKGERKNILFLCRCFFKIAFFSEFIGNYMKALEYELFPFFFYSVLFLFK
jgi:hypothetical protein